MLHVSLCVYYISRLRFSVISGMSEVYEQNVCIKLCVRLGKTGSETFEMLKQAFGDSSMSRSRTFEWFGRFKNGRTSTANDDRSGRPSTARQKPPQMWNRYGRLSTRIVVYHTRSMCRGWIWLWILSANSDKTAEHASDCS